MITCKEYVEHKKELIKRMVSGCKRTPKLCVIQIGDDPASSSYVKGKRRDCEEVGIEFAHIHIKDYSHFTEGDLLDLIRIQNKDDEVDGIIVQLPIPAKYSVKRVQEQIKRKKDVDGFRKCSDFTPCTPKGIMDWLDYNHYEFEGKEVVVAGRSEIVGKPLVNLLIDRGATVTCINSKTKSPFSFTSHADLFISAIGKAEHWTAWDFQRGTLIVDVGINRDEDGKLCGDVERELTEKLRGEVYATPVPNGVGLLTRLALLENTLEANRKN